MKDYYKYTGGYVANEVVTCPSDYTDEKGRFLESAQYGDIDFIMSNHANQSQESIKEALNLAIENGQILVVHFFRKTCPLLYSNFFKPCFIENSFDNLTENSSDLFEYFIRNDSIYENNESSSIKEFHVQYVQKTLIKLFNDSIMHSNINILDEVCEVYFKKVGVCIISDINILKDCVENSRIDLLHCLFSNIEISLHELKEIFSEEKEDQEIELLNIRKTVLEKEKKQVQKLLDKLIEKNATSQEADLSEQEQFESDLEDITSELEEFDELFQKVEDDFNDYKSRYCCLIDEIEKLKRKLILLAIKNGNKDIYDFLSSKTYLNSVYYDCKEFINEWFYNKFNESEAFCYDENWDEYDSDYNYTNCSNHPEENILYDKYYRLMVKSKNPDFTYLAASKRSVDFLFESALASGNIEFFDLISTPSKSFYLKANIVNKNIDFESKNLSSLLLEENNKYISYILKNKIKLMHVAELACEKGLLCSLRRIPNEIFTLKFIFELILVAAEYGHAHIIRHLNNEIELNPDLKDKSFSFLPLLEEFTTYEEDEDEDGLLDIKSKEFIETYTYEILSSLEHIHDIRYENFNFHKSFVYGHALRKSAFNNHINTLELLLEYIETNKINSQLINLNELCENGNVCAIEKLLDFYGIPVNEDMLCSAVKSGNSYLLKILLKRMTLKNLTNEIFRKVALSITKYSNAYTFTILCRPPYNFNIDDHGILQELLCKAVANTNIALTFFFLEKCASITDEIINLAESMEMEIKNKSNEWKDKEFTYQKSINITWLLKNNDELLVTSDRAYAPT